MTSVRYRMYGGLVGTVLILCLVGCSQPLNKREKGTLLGGGLGAATGAIIGSAVGAPGAGAAIGGGLGAFTGGLIGDQIMGVENRQYAMQRQLNAQRRELRRQRRTINRLKHRPKTNKDLDEWGEANTGTKSFTASSE